VVSLKLSTSENVAKFFSISVEDAVNQMFSAVTDQKGYINKARSLSFNLKKNEVRYNFLLCCTVLVCSVNPLTVLL
jgi:hypothetical protein